MILTETVFKKNDYSLFWKRVITGSLINLLLLSFILISTGETASWIWIPILTVTVAGAVSGTIFYILKDKLDTSGWKKIASTVVCLITHLIGFWLGMVFALAQVGLWD